MDGKMNIYIASSWKNQHAVEMLTEILEGNGHIVFSFVREAYIKENDEFDLYTWIESEDGKRKFDYDIGSAMNSDLIIYISPSGSDAWAEVGAAYANGVPIFGLISKGEQIGLMRRMVAKWFTNYKDLIEAISCYCGVIGLAK
jgi:hypothetical protein